MKGKIIGIPRKGDDSAVVYCIRNMTNGKVYIGKTESFRQRMTQHISCLRRGEHNNDMLQEDYNKGHTFAITKVFECIDVDETKCSKRDLLLFVEYICIRAYNADTDGYNGGFMNALKISCMPKEMEVVLKPEIERLMYKYRSEFELVVLEKSTGDIYPTRKRMQPKILT